ncbi:MAG: hypothetical protein GEV00_19510 [Actinophytocola sp.]|nr:hypothetical protein [Actinophytocola sp.]
MLVGDGIVRPVGEHILVPRRRRWDRHADADGDPVAAHELLVSAATLLPACPEGTTVSAALDDPRWSPRTSLTEGLRQTLAWFEHGQ